MYIRDADVALTIILGLSRRFTPVASKEKGRFSKVPDPFANGRGADNWINRGCPGHAGKMPIWPRENGLRLSNEGKEQ
tara:strand:- start:3335 stop:3568 length:234 start_codon:yes stop_codon:yes gene_type:complete